MKNQLAQRLTELLQDNDISMRKLASGIGVSAMSISDWANGNGQPTAENIYNLAVFFGVSTDYLLGLEE